MTPIDPPPGLLDKVREATDAVRDAHEYYASHGPARHVYGCTGCDARFPDRHGHPAHVADLVDRAAWDAVVEGLGLTEEARTRCTGCGSTGATERLTNHYLGFDEPIKYAHERRLVSRWEPKP